MDFLTAISRGTFLLDGATGTQLQQRGLPPGACTEAWVLENSQALIDVQRAYAEAGANAVYAPTFGANRLSLRAHGYADNVREMCLRLVDLSRLAVGDRVFVGGDISPTGQQVYPVGSITFDELTDVFAEQAAALETAGVDFFVVETQMSLAEARAAVTAVRAVSQKPVIVSFSCTAGGRTLFGGDLAAALLSLQDMGVAAFGVNCCGDLSLLTELIGRLAAYAAIPLIAKPNAGLPDLSAGQAAYHMTPAALAAFIPGLIQAGARLLGGCCGTDARHIAAIAEAAASVPVPEFAPAGPPACASEHTVLPLAETLKIAELPLTEDILSDVEDVEDADALRICIRSREDLEILMENQYGLRLPLFVDCPDGALLAQFLRIYNGKPVLL